MSSNENQLKTFIDERLPMYGSLNIQNVNVFLSSSKKRFDVMYDLSCPYKADRSAFEILVVLGKGHYGAVYLARNKRKYLYAMKAMKKRRLVKNQQVDHAFNEKRILQSIDFPFGVRMEYFSKDNSYIYFFLPFITGGEMFYHLRAAEKFTEPIAMFYAAQIVLGLEYLHHMDLIYRDLKPENLMIDHLGYLKITDFGFTKLVPLRTYTLCGTPAYFAPEAIKGQGYSKSVDWWSFGVLVFEMNAGYEPFRSRNRARRLMKILVGKYETPKFFSPVLADLVSRLLTADVSERIGNLKDGALDLKRHAYFKPINWLALFNRRVKSPYIPQTNNLSLNFPLENCKDSDLKISNENELDEFFKDF